MDTQSFYDEKARTYRRQDKEASVRYSRALDLAGVSDGAVILDVGCKFAYLRDLLKQRERLGRLLRHRHIRGHRQPDSRSG